MIFIKIIWPGYINKFGFGGIKREGIYRQADWDFFIVFRYNFDVDLQVIFAEFSCIIFGVDNI